MPRHADADPVALMNEDRWGVSWMLDTYRASYRYFREALVTAMEAKAIPIALDVMGGIAAVRA